MDRVELKTKAKEMIKDNKWFIWKPIIIYSAIIFAITFIATILDQAFGLTKTEIVEVVNGISYTRTTGTISSIIGIIIGIVSCAVAIGYAYYILSFIRGKKLEMKDIIDFAKKNWVKAVLVSLIVGIIIAVGTVLLVIPGIIAEVGLVFYQETCADNLELGYMDTVKKAWAITKGHKMDIFLLQLSFIGWALLAVLTLGILYIWLMPYMVVTLTLAYEKLKAAN